ncbi:hypothetical protein D3C76_1327000 [compost metagenome]
MADGHVADQRVRHRFEQHRGDVRVRAFVGGQLASHIQGHGSKAGQPHRLRFSDDFAREVLVEP